MTQFSHQIRFRGCKRVMRKFATYPDQVASDCLHVCMWLACLLYLLTYSHDYKACAFAINTLFSCSNKCVTCWISCWRKSKVIFPGSDCDEVSEQLFLFKLWSVCWIILLWFDLWVHSCSVVRFLLHLAPKQPFLFVVWWTHYSHNFVGFAK